MASRLVIGEFNFEEEKRRERQDGAPEKCPYCGSEDVRFHPCPGAHHHKGAWICFDCDKVVQEGGVPDEAFE